jgi:ATP-dependent protease ClpP protease subunit
MIYDTHEFGILIDTREIFLSSDLAYDYDEAMIDHRAANTFIRNLRILNNLGTDPILIHQCTVGGDWNYGIAIYDAIKASSSNIIIICHAHARSMGSIIPQAATWRVIMPNADLLIHWGTLEQGGNYTSVQAEAHWGRRIAEKMLDIYISRCKEGQFWEREGIETEEEIREFLRDNMNKKQEWYMTPREAVDMGFFDAVLGDDEFETIKQLRSDE